jgi:hypothetical protein
MHNLPCFGAETTAPAPIAPVEEWGTTIRSVDLDHRRRLRVSFEAHDNQGRIVVTRWRRRAGAWNPDRRQTISLSRREAKVVADALAGALAMRHLEARS